MYLSFEDDVERVSLCSFSNNDVFVLVFHLEEIKWDALMLIHTGL